MPGCVTIAEVSFGTALALDVGITDMSGCYFVVLTPAEYAASLNTGSGTVSPTGPNQLFAMTVPEAQIISIGIGTVWAIAWGFRQIRLALSIDESKE